ncbi:MAG: YlxR family protein [Phormidesmis sp.]
MAEKNHRLCISCRQTAHRDTLWRIVRTFPDRTVSLADGMGRSAYLCRNQRCLENAQKKNRLGKALRSPIPPEIYKELHNLLNQHLAEQAPSTLVSSQ